MSDSKELIYLAEDSKTHAFQLRTLLENANWPVTIFEDGKQAWEAICNQRPDLLITDLNMPEYDGLQLVEMIKERWPGLPVILTTAAGSEEVAVKALKLGAVSYVPKEAAFKHLVETVEQVLSLAREQRLSQRLIACQTALESTHSLPNDPSLIPQMVARIRDHVQQLGLCAESELIPVSIALDEALLNAMIHGNLEISSEIRELEDGRIYQQLLKERMGSSPYCDRRVHVTLKATRTEARIQIRDEGPGFDRSLIPDPRDNANMDKLGGRGLLLISTFMDEVIHNESGNCITMVKRIHDPIPLAQ